MSGTLAEAADAFLFLEPRDQLTQFVPKRSELEGTAYAQEVERRLTIVLGPGKVPDFMPKNDDGQAPQYTPLRSPVH